MNIWFITARKQSQAAASFMESVQRFMAYSELHRVFNLTLGKAVREMRDGVSVYGTSATTPIASALHLLRGLLSAKDVMVASSRTGMWMAYIAKFISPQRQIVLVVDGETISGMLGSFLLGRMAKHAMKVYALDMIAVRALDIELDLEAELVDLPVSAHGVEVDDVLLAAYGVSAQNYVTLIAHSDMSIEDVLSVSKQAEKNGLKTIVVSPRIGGELDSLRFHGIRVIPSARVSLLPHLFAAARATVALEADEQNAPLLLKAAAFGSPLFTKRGYRYLFEGELSEMFDEVSDLEKFLHDDVALGAMSHLGKIMIAANHDPLKIAVQMEIELESGLRARGFELEHQVKA
jgi:hypothetical protein